MNKIPKCTLVPIRCYDEKDPGCFLSEVCTLTPGTAVAAVKVPSLDAMLVYADYGEGAPLLLELLSGIWNCSGYSKILASFKDGVLSLAIAMGSDLRLANVYEAPDFTTAEYFIFAAMKSLQLNPEVSTIRFLEPLSEEQKMSLYRYFYSVEPICG